MAGARHPAGGPDCAKDAAERLHSGHMRSRLAPEGQGHRYADYHRNHHELILRVGDAGCDADGVPAPVRAGRPRYTR